LKPKRLQTINEKQELCPGLCGIESGIPKRKPLDSPGAFVLNRVLMMGIMAVISPLAAESLSAGGRI
jgi:hypothetical protein